MHTIHVLSTTCTGVLYTHVTGSHVIAVCFVWIHRCVVERIRKPCMHLWLQHAKHVLTSCSFKTHNV